MIRRALTLSLLFASLFAFGQRNNTFYVDQFPGAKVADKTAAAQAACNTNTAIPCIIVFDPELAVYATGSMPSKCAQCVWQDFRSFGNSNAFTVANAGVYTNTQMNLYSESLIGGCNPQTEFQRGQAGNFSTDAITACNQAPANSTVLQANGIGAYAVSSTNPGSPGTFLGAPVAVYGQATALADNQQTWGANFVAEDDGARTTGVTHHGIEVDIGEQSVNTAYFALYGVASILQGAGTGNVTNSWAFVASTRAFQGHPWNIGFWSAPGAATNAVVAGPTCMSGSCNSQIVRFDALLSSSPVQSSMGGDTSGNIRIDPASGAAAVVSKPVIIIPGAFSTLPSCISAREGAIAAVNDSTTAVWGATITGSGANHVEAYCDGTVWTVAGK